MIDRSSFFSNCRSVFGVNFFNSHNAEFDSIYKKCFFDYYGERYEDYILRSIEDDVFSPITDVMDDLPF